eukprot:CAMPEP_0194749360 /NCGR_PEP_ID=MMETSP0323_2-20130528/3561_1 /TAXON_ID=2866 ORGANISM="Crypthecodinium cohnii, Strain Seligo" /NCGR_SAMPLE_ID=MMETSP0323_2 /ASSEMBLY_ACC=CAM_ASM_000346 /LENGTH=139 /DNA_ID=CAMNT_0039664409 /DNA_START=161 /DNA_END=580 /DNA_ORIENTATION=+
MRCIHRATLNDLGMLFHLTGILIPNQDDHRSVIIVLIAVVRCGEHCQELPASKMLVAMLNTLVCTDDKLEAVPLIEFVDSVRPETARVLAAGRWVHSEYLVIFGRVGPQGMQNNAIPVSGGCGDFTNHLDRFRYISQVI